jgi:hypothetical protein
MLRGLFTSIANPLFLRAGWLLFWQTRGVEAGAEPKPVDAAWHGLQEAELSEEERNLAARRLAQEEALRKARGD